MDRQPDDELDPHEPVDAGLAERALADLRAAVVRPPSEGVAARHVELMVRAAAETPALRVVGGEGPVPDVVPVPGPGPAEVVPLRRRGRGLVAAVAAVAVLAGLGGLGSAGALPGPVQDVVASVVRPLGLDFPTGAGSRRHAGEHHDARRTGRGSGQQRRTGVDGHVRWRSHRG